LLFNGLLNWYISFLVLLTSFIQVLVFRSSFLWSLWVYISHKHVGARIVILLVALGLELIHSIKLFICFANAVHLYKIVKRIIHVLFL